MNLQKRMLKRLKRLLIEERWFNNAEFDGLFVHTYLNTKTLVLGYKAPMFILMDKRCDILRISSSSIKETEEEILKANLMLSEKLGFDNSSRAGLVSDIDSSPTVQDASEDWILLPPIPHSYGRFYRIPYGNSE